MVRLPNKRTFEQAREVYELHAKATTREVIPTHHAHSRCTDSGTWILADGIETVARVSADGAVTIVASDVLTSH